MASLRELEYAATQVEQGRSKQDQDYLKWLYMLISLGASLGGARAHASLANDNQHLWIAKFPSRYNDIDVAALKMLCL